MKIKRSKLEQIVKEELARRLSNLFEGDVEKVLASLGDDDKKDDDVDDALQSLVGDPSSDPLASAAEEKNLGAILSGGEEQPKKEDPDGDGEDEAKKAAEEKKYDDSDAEALKKPIAEQIKGRKVSRIKIKEGSDLFPSLSAKEVVVTFDGMEDDPFRIIAVSKGGKVDLTYSFRGIEKNSLDK